MNSTDISSELHQQQGRSVAEMVIKTIALSAATTIAAGHLTTLRKQPIRLASYQVLVTLFISTFPLSDFAISVCRTLKALSRQNPRSSIRYYLGAALDERAVSGSLGDEGSVPLTLIPCQSLEAHSEPYDIKWFARLSILLVFMPQAFLTIWLWFRRLQHGARTYLDDYIALTAIGGLTIALISASITLLNTSWQVSERYPAPIKKHYTKPSPLDLLYQFTWQTTLIELRVSLIIGIVLRSIGFFTLRGTSAIDYTNSLPYEGPGPAALRQSSSYAFCTTPIQVLAGNQFSGGGGEYACGPRRRVSDGQQLQRRLVIPGRHGESKACVRSALVSVFCWPFSMRFTPDYC